MNDHYSEIQDTFLFDSPSKAFNSVLNSNNNNINGNKYGYTGIRSINSTPSRNILGENPLSIQNSPLSGMMGHHGETGFTPFKNSPPIISFDDTFYNHGIDSDFILKTTKTPNHYQQQTLQQQPQQQQINNTHQPALNQQQNLNSQTTPSPPLTYNNQFHTQFFKSPNHFESSPLKLNSNNTPIFQQLKSPYHLSPDRNSKYNISNNVNNNHHFQNLSNSAKKLIKNNNAYNNDLNHIFDLFTDEVLDVNQPKSNTTMTTTTTTTTITPNNNNSPTNISLINNNDNNIDEIKNLNILNQNLDLKKLYKSEFSNEHFSYQKGLCESVFEVELLEENDGATRIISAKKKNMQTGPFDQNTIQELQKKYDDKVSQISLYKLLKILISNQQPSNSNNSSNSNNNKEITLPPISQQSPQDQAELLNFKPEQRPHHSISDFDALIRQQNNTNDESLKHENLLKNHISFYKNNVKKSFKQNFKKRKEKFSERIEIINNTIRDHHNQQLQAQSNVYQ
ncbi:hypothetical protein DICPUDRAFT_99491 [Dictyostelium purpureum]|uniref:Uncharacterized protein n=1 Tax=Dictyostelium purpureum TaxID=5786 RepID=F0ZZP1_DICPU|nr:uncharacterized protein DICPUDRAFT_99491 [Dictyostelium purpureum]EGC30598.1 hypothetical protein DICPUDRAFT_99491 [Dictyostelium purpureum]|eukprot:XP_003292886.1 hypothetical protein DICPUDRAFT_99491 [Dictyostelium purpureum]